MQAEVAIEIPGGARLGPGLWRWTAYHTDWKQDVGCVAYTDGPDLVLIDPLAPDGATAARRFWNALDHEVRGRGAPVHVVVTVRWHERHAPQVVERYADDPGVELWAPAGAVQHLSRRPEHAFTERDRLPGGIVAHGTARPDEVVLWLPRAAAIVSGDTLLGGKRKPLRVCPQGWLPSGVTRAKLVSSLAPLLDLPVEVIVPAHGEPIREDARGVLSRALADCG